MFARVFRTLVIVTGFISASASVAGQAEGRGGKPSFLIVGIQTSVPFGWVDFCFRYNGECETPITQAVDVVLKGETFQTIERINAQVNTTIKAVSDIDHWHVVDRWDYPTDGAGDCEDYALLKRKLLVEAGFPRQALLMTIVKDQNGEGHAVLTVRTNRGDLILDNLRADVKMWTETGYRFVKRQSQRDANTWVELRDPASVMMMVSR